jgi:hypothetical protein
VEPLVWHVALRKKEAARMDLVGPLRRIPIQTTSVRSVHAMERLFARCLQPMAVNAAWMRNAVLSIASMAFVAIRCA